MKKETMSARFAGKQCKRVVALVLALVMMLSLVPAQMFSFAESSEPESTVTLPQGGTYGTCTWEVDVNGKLTIAPANGFIGTMPSLINEDDKFEAYMQGMLSGLSGFFTKSDLTDPESYYFFARSAPDSVGSWPWNARSNPDLAKAITSVKIENGVRPSITKFTYPYINTCDISDMFYGLENCVTMDVSGLDISGVSKKLNSLYMNNTFANCSSLKEIIGIENWRPNAIYQTSYMFSGCESLVSLEIPYWYFSDNDDPVKADNMFKDCVNLTSLNLYGWSGLGLYANLSRMFYNCRKLSDLNIFEFYVSAGSDFTEMFYNCVSLREMSFYNWNFRPGWEEETTGMFGYGAEYGPVVLTGYYIGNSWLNSNDSIYNALPVNKVDLTKTDDGYVFSYVPGRIGYTSYAVKSVTIANVLNDAGDTYEQIEVDLRENPDSYTVPAANYNSYTWAYITFDVACNALFRDSQNDAYLKSTGLYSQNGVIGDPIIDPYADRSAVPTVFGFKHFVEWNPDDLVFGYSEDDNPQKIFDAVYDDNQYIIRYHANGGEGSMPDQPYVYGKGIDFLENKFSRENAEFAGWSLNPDDVYTITNTTLDDLVAELRHEPPANGSVIDVYAIWENDIRIRFNANGGEGTMEDQYITAGSSETLNPNQFTREYYSFAGWALEADKTKVVYGDQQSAAKIAHDAQYGSKYTEDEVLDLYAVWSSGGTVIHFDANGGEGEMADQHIPYNTWAYLNANEFTRLGHTFLGWSLDPNATTVTYTDKQRVRNIIEAGEVTLYAVWSADEYTIVYYNQTKSNSYSQTATYPDEFELLPNTFTRKGYKFMGWDHDAGANSANVIFTDKQTVTLGEMYDTLGIDPSVKTIYLSAVWEPITYSVIFDPNGGGGEPVRIDNLVYDESEVYLPHIDELGFTAPEGKRWAQCWDWPRHTYGYGSSVKNLTAVDGDVVTIKAVWEDDTYTIYYQSYKWVEDGGYYSSEYFYPVYGIPYDTPVTIDNPGGFTHDNGEVLIGWDTEYPGTNVVYKNPETVENGVCQRPDTYIYLYAVWSDCYTVHFDANGGEGEMEDQEIPYGVETPLNKNEFTREDYTFLGWSTDSEAAEETYADQEAVLNLANPGEEITLYAIWEYDGYIVHFDANGGEGEMEDQYFLYDEVKALSANEFTREGHAFMGWSTDPDATIQQYLDKQRVKNLTTGKEITLYAVWAETQVKFKSTRVVWSNSLRMEYYFPLDAVEDWTGYYVHVVRAYSDGRPNVSFDIPFEEWTIKSGKYCVGYDDFAAKEMNDEITLVIYNAEGKPISKPVSEGIKSYAMRGFEYATSDLERTALVEMLNYGAQMQLYKGYRIDDLATNKFTDEHWKYVIKEDPEMNTVLEYEKGKYAKSILITESNIKYRMFFRGITPDMTAKVELKNHWDETVVTEYTGSDFVQSGDLYYFDVESMVVADARCPFTATIYNADGSVYTTCTDSIESYCLRAIKADPAFEDMAKATLTFCDAVYAYLHRND